MNPPDDLMTGIFIPDSHKPNFLVDNARRSVSGLPGRPGFEHELLVAVGTVDTAVVAQVEIHTRMTERSATSIAADGAFFDFNDFGRLDGHGLAPDLVDGRRAGGRRVDPGWAE